MLARRTSVEEIARFTGVRPLLLQRLIDLRLIIPQPSYTEAELRELRRACRLIDDVGFEAEAVEVLLRMRRHILALQREVVRLQAALRRPGARPEDSRPTMDWSDIVDGELD